MLGVKPLFGAAFPPDATEKSRLAVLSYATWEKAYGTDRNVIGQTVMLNDEAYQIAGVLPAGQPVYMGGDVFVLFDRVPRDTGDFPLVRSWF